MAQESRDGYTAIDLTGPEAKDSLGNDLSTYFRYRKQLSDHRQYWLKESIIQDSNEVTRIISEDLMEQDYSENALEIRSMYDGGNITFGDKVAYHQNHGTAHGLRQREYQTQYLQLVRQCGADVYQQAASHLTIEEVELMRLAAYTHRLGRTNERGFKGDPLYGPRAAQIFTHLATSLGFNPLLITSIASTMNVFRSGDQIRDQDHGGGPEPAIQGFKDDPKGVARHKGILFERLIEMGHITDLVRCQSPHEEESNKTKIMNRISGLLQPGMDAKWITDAFFDMASALCQATGANVIKKTSYKKGDLRLIVEAATQPLKTVSTLKIEAQKAMNEIFSRCENKISIEATVSLATDPELTNAPNKKQSNTTTSKGKTIAGVVGIVLGSAAAGAGMGALVGTFVLPVIGTFIGAVIGALTVATVGGLAFVISKKRGSESDSNGQHSVSIPSTAATPLPKVLSKEKLVPSSGFSFWHPIPTTSKVVDGHEIKCGLS